MEYVSTGPLHSIVIFFLFVSFFMLFLFVLIFVEFISVHPGDSTNTLICDVPEPSTGRRQHQPGLRLEEWFKLKIHPFLRR